VRDELRERRADIVVQHEIGRISSNSVSSG